jgi:hypothetical protein
VWVWVADWVIFKRCRRRGFVPFIFSNVAAGEVWVVEVVLGGGDLCRPRDLVVHAVTVDVSGRVPVGSG